MIIMAERPRKETGESPRQILGKELSPVQKALPPRPSKTSLQKEPGYWERFDDLFYRTIGHAETSFRVNIAINIVVVIIGVIIIMYSIAYSWTKSLDLYSTAFATLGVISFVATFYLTPQMKIQEVTGDLVQLQMCYRTYAAHWEAINDYLYYHEEQMSLDDLDKVNSQLEKLTSASVDVIERFIGKEKEKEEKKPNSANS